MNIFAQASKKKLTFATSIGIIMTDDLWDIDLVMLDDMAISYKEEIELATGESFLKKRVRPNPTTKLQLDICKAVIESRVETAERNEKAANKRARNAKIREIIFEKENAELLATDKEELYKMLDEDDAAEEAE